MRQYFVLKLISIIHSLSKLINDNVEEIKFLLIYNTDGYFTYLNN